MLEGFEPTVLASAVKRGRPAQLSSTRLRNLAWLRALLDRLDVMRHWGGAGDGDDPPNEGDAPPVAWPPSPPGWQRRPADAALLRQAFVANGDRLPADPRARPTSLLDDILGPLFAGVDGAGGRYFSDRIARAEASPDAGRLQRLDDLVLGSRAAFEGDPPGVDPWFYDALDFSNAWFAKVYLWRAMDPLLEDPGWDELLTAGGRVAMPVANLRFAPFTLSATDLHSFESLVEHAAALTAYPHVASAPVEEHHAAVASVAEAAVGASGVATRALAEAVSSLVAERQWVALSNGLAARRLSQMLAVADAVTAWWLRTVHTSLGEAFRALEERSYLRPRRSHPPIDDVVATVG